MKIKKEERINNEMTILILDYKKGQVIEISKHFDYYMGQPKSFWRVDYQGKTISSLNRTKAEAMKDARKFAKTL